MTGKYFEKDKNAVNNNPKVKIYIPRSYIVG